MAMKPYAAFGHILICNSYNKGDVYIADVEEGTPCTIFWAKGHYKNRNISEDKDFKDFPRGTFLRPSDLIPGLFEHTVIEDSDVFCYDPRLNKGKTLTLVPLQLPGGTETILPKGTKLFLCSGSIAINGTNFDKPTQLHIQSKDTLVTINSDCYGLLFP